MVEVAIADPLTDGTIFGFVYLFVSEKVETTGTYINIQFQLILLIGHNGRGCHSRSLTQSIR